MKNILIAFVSANKAGQLKTPNIFTIPNGEKIACWQTNETAVCYLVRELASGSPPQTLAQVFLITSEEAKKAIDGYPEPKTPLEVFYEHIEQYEPLLHDIRNICQEIAYNENGSMNSCILEVADIAKSIQTYMDHVEDDLCVYADMTGGPRHASMMMLAVMQLLTTLSIRHRITIGRVFYANLNVAQHQGHIDDATEIQRMTMLITGAHEFVHYGSVKAIEAYFENLSENEQTLELHYLLRAMHAFSDAIKVCQVGRIRQELQSLGQWIDAFQEEIDSIERGSGSHLQERLFRFMLDTIREEYADVLKEDADDINIIAWCTKKGFWQQALTLCTEWLPLYFSDHGIVYTTQDAVQSFCKEQSSKILGTWEKVLLSLYKSESYKNALSPAASAIRDHISAWEKGMQTRKATADALRSICPEISRALDDFPRMLSWMEKRGYRFVEAYVLETDFPAIYKLLRLLTHPRKVEGEWRQFLRSLDFRAFPKGLTGVDKNRLHEIYHVNLMPAFHPLPPKSQQWVQQAIHALPPLQTQEKKLQSEDANFQEMFLKNEIETAYSIEDAMTCLRAYSELRFARNQMNHANPEKTYDAEEIQSMIQQMLVHLRRFRQEAEAQEAE